MIPRALRIEMMERLHEGHQGLEKCYRRAKEGVWWPGMRADLDDMIYRCEVCIKERGIRLQPLVNTLRPEGLWEVVGSGLFEFKGVPYVLIVDYFSRWIEVVELRDMTAGSVVHRMKRVFARLGILREIRTDNGPCYASQTFKTF